MRVQERPPPFVGRDELETLMASPSADDWVRLSERLLGKVPANFVFTPKHKSAAYEGDKGPILAEG
jgi:tRNA-dihydrouridine synthase 3